MRAFILGSLITVYLRVVGWTSKVQYKGEENIPAKPFMYVFWHSRIMFLVHMHKGRGINFLCSPSKDGRVSAFVNTSLGYRVIWGTASEANTGTSIVRSIARRLREKQVVGITPDGPRGPAEKVKPGTAFISRVSGCPVVPVSCAVKRKKFLRSWDRFILPLPFNRGVSVYGPPLNVNKNEDIVAACRRIEQAIRAVTFEADRIAAGM